MTVLRAYAAFFAGNRMHWARFLVFNASGGIAWSACYAFAAFALGSAATGIGIGSTLTWAGLGVAMVVAGRRWMRRLGQRTDAAYPDDTPAAPEAEGETGADDIGHRPLTRAGSRSA